MTLLSRRNRTLPSLASDLFDTGRFPSLFDLDRDMDINSRFAELVPDANIEETEKEYKLDLAVPGLERKDFKVEIENGILTVSAEKEEEKTEENKNYKRREFSYNSFSRSFTIPENSVQDKIEAKYENGILHLTLPKKEVTVSKPVKEIKVS